MQRNLPKVTKTDGTVPMSESEAKASGSVDQCQNEAAKGQLSNTHEPTQKSASKPLSVEEQSTEDSSLL